MDSIDHIAQFNYPDDSKGVGNMENIANKNMRQFGVAHEI